MHVCIARCYCLLLRSHTLGHQHNDDVCQLFICILPLSSSSLHIIVIIVRLRSDRHFVTSIRLLKLSIYAWNKFHFIFQCIVGCISDSCPKPNIMSYQKCWLLDIDDSVKSTTRWRTSFTNGKAWPERVFNVNSKRFMAQKQQTKATKTTKKSKWIFKKKKKTRHSKIVKWQIPTSIFFRCTTVLCPTS